MSVPFSKGGPHKGPTRATKLSQITHEATFGVSRGASSRVTRKNVRNSGFAAFRAARITAGDTATQATTRAAREVGLTTNRRQPQPSPAKARKGGSPFPNRNPDKGTPITGWP